MFPCRHPSHKEGGGGFFSYQVFSRFYSILGDLLPVMLVTHVIFSIMYDSVCLCAHQLGLLIASFAMNTESLCGWPPSFLVSCSIAAGRPSSLSPLSQCDTERTFTA